MPFISVIDITIYSSITIAIIIIIIIVIIIIIIILIVALLTSPGPSEDSAAVGAAGTSGAPNVQARRRE